MGVIHYLAKDTFQDMTAMGFKIKNGYKFSATAFGALLEREKKRESKFRHLVLIFGAIFGIPMLFLGGCRT